MKRLIAALLAVLATSVFGATLNPISLLNPAGSSSGQVIMSTGASSAPAWSTVTLSGLGGTVAIANGGTGATTQSAALSNLLGSSAVPLANGGTGAASASAARTNLGLGTAAIANTGTSGATVPLLNGANTWSSAQTFSVRPTFNNNTPWDTGNLATAVSSVNGSSGAVTVPIAGRLLNVQVFTATGTYTPTSGTSKALVEVQAPGGGGGGVAATAAGQNAIAQSGSGGSYAQVYLTTVSSLTVTIGTVGSAGASGVNAGGAGGATSFGSVVSCPGGRGGAGAGPQATGFVQNGAASPGACTVTGATTLRSIAGASASPVANLNSAAAYAVPGGLAAMGFNASNGNGSGGSGAAIPASTGATAGNAGVSGKVIVYEYN